MLLGLKVVTTFFEAARYHYISVNGHAEFWSAIYFIMSFIKGTFMFTVILLIGSGWSLVKPFLNDREKKIIWVVLVLQVIDNIAVVMLSQETEGEKLYEDWSALLHLVDILCCCAVLIPIVWQVNSLEKTVQAEQTSNKDSKSEANKSIINVETEVPATAEAARTLQKLKQFRSFYLLVVVYIYFTRIAVFLIATELGFRQMWIRYFITELATLAFYVVVGFMFRPVEDNPYLEVSRDEKTDFEIEFSDH
jgi:NADH:ubiquinone oxidoreductase subunit 3 (subunit A)